MKELINRLEELNRQAEKVVETPVSRNNISSEN